MIALALLAAAPAADLTYEARAELDGVGVTDDAHVLSGGRGVPSGGVAASVDLGDHLGVDLGWHYGRRTVVVAPQQADPSFDARFGVHRLELGARAQWPVEGIFTPYVGLRGALALARYRMDQDLDHAGSAIELASRAVAPGYEAVIGFAVGNPLRDADDAYGSDPRIGVVVRFELGWSGFAPLAFEGLGDAGIGGPTGTLAIGARYR